MNQPSRQERRREELKRKNQARRQNENAQESRRDSLRTTETQLENPSRLRRNYHSDHHDRFR
jgi:hypothetical protein